MPLHQFLQQSRLPVYMYIYIYIYICIYIYIHMYERAPRRGRSREKERSDGPLDPVVAASAHAAVRKVILVRVISIILIINYWHIVCVYIYIYIYREREICLCIAGVRPSCQSPY